MKKHLLLLTLMLISGFLSAQHIRLDDTVVVFKLKYKTPNGTIIIKYIPYTTPRTIRWTDKQNNVHESILRGINPHYLLLDTTRVFTSDINALVMTHLPDAWQYTYRKTKPVLFDSTGLFDIMSYYDFRHLVQAASYSTTVQRIPNPFFVKMTYEKFVAGLERKRQRRLKMLAALDTCPMRYGIKTNIMRDLLNEINLSFEIPLRRNFCIDLGIGVLYNRSDKNTFRYDEAFAQFGFLKSGNQFWFDHSYNNRKGFGFEVIPKFFLTKKKILYIGSQLCLRFYHYQNKWVFNYHDDHNLDLFSFQSEKSTAFHLHAIVGVQTPQIKRFLFDAFIAFGFMYRGGNVSETVSKITNNYYGTHYEYYDPPKTFEGGGFSLSGQIGLRMGLRFGRARLFK